MKKNRSNKGFTLVEIMIVVVIIALLAAMAIPAFQKVRKTSQQNTVMNNLRQVNAAAQQYFMEDKSGATTVVGSQLIGTETTKWIKNIQPVVDESYTGLTINSTASFITISPTGLGAVTYVQ
jgi:type IV pilus assembly protein PilA